MSMKRIDKLLVNYHNRRVGTLSLTPDNRLCAFEYDRGWLADGFSISPLELPLKSGLFVARPEPFYGNFGVFDDSLPDGYGRYLLHKALENKGINDSDLSCLDRLSLVGLGGMGALTYEPDRTLHTADETADFDELQARALAVLQEKNPDDAEWLLFRSGNSGGCRPKAIFTDADGHWLVKFRHHYDPLDMGLREYRYNEVARRCGITVPDFKLTNGRYFTSRRFDISPKGECIHTVTAGGLMGVSLAQPVLDYSHLLALTGYLTHSRADVEQMFRRMVFNYAAENKDDHCKNFSFMVTADDAGRPTWRLAPAYDLTRCTEGYNGEHATSVNGTGHPNEADMVAVGAKGQLKPSRCREIIEEVTALCRELKEER
jgi:serine/threonine-protein kinase HipA